MSEKLDEETWSEILDDFDELTISRDLENPSREIFEIIGLALYNGFEIHRTQSTLTLKTSKGPVLDKPSDQGYTLDKINSLINVYIEKIMEEQEFACGHKRDGIRGFRYFLQQEVQD